LKDIEVTGRIILKLILNEMWCDEGILLPCDRDEWLAVVNTVMDLRVI
jgi:hypothetical protein